MMRLRHPLHFAIKILAVAAVLGAAGFVAFGLASPKQTSAQSRSYRVTMPYLARDAGSAAPVSTPTPTRTSTPTPTSTPVSPPLNPADYVLGNSFKTSSGTLEVTKSEFASEWEPGCDFKLPIPTCYRPSSNTDRFLIVTLNKVSDDSAPATDTRKAFVVGDSGKVVTWLIQSVKRAGSGNAETNFVFTVPKTENDYRFYWLGNYVILGR